MPRSPYDILQLTPGASVSEAKAAFRRLAKCCHPDAAPGDAAAARQFQEISDAYAAIATRRTPHPARRGRQSAAGPTTPPPQPQPQAGAHRRARVTISLEDAVAGGVRDIALAGPRPTPVRIPAGVEHGAALRLPGLGEPGRDGGAPGDAFIEVRIAPHPFFRLDGANAHLLLRVTPRHLARGGGVETPTPVGPVNMLVPEGARPGQILRLRGKGLPARGGRPAGDLFVTLRVGDLTAPIELTGAHRDAAA